MFPHSKKIEVVNAIETVDISEIAEEISIDVARSRPLRPGEYVFLSNEGELPKLAGAIVTNSSSSKIQEGYESSLTRITDQKAPAIYGVLANACLFGPYQMIVLPDGRFLRESITLDRDHITNNHLFAQRFQNYQVRNQKVDVPLFRATHHHSQNYGHFLRDSLTFGRVLDFFRFPSNIKSCFHGAETKFICDLLSHFRPNDEYFVNQGLAVETDELHFVSQPPISTLAMDYIRKNATQIVKNERRNWRTVAKQIRSYVPSIYVSRSGARRAIANEAQIQPLLKKYNIQQVTPHELTATEQMHLFSNANFLMGAWGASLCNCTFMPEHSIVLELCDPYRYDDRWYMEYISYSRCHYGKIVGNVPPGHQYRTWDDTQVDFTISPELLDDALGQLFI